MKLEATKDFAHAENMVTVIERTKGELFEVNNDEHAERLIAAKFAKKAGAKETKVIEVEETK